MNQVFKKHLVNFSKFTFVGTIMSLLNIFFVWLLIDILAIKTVIASSVVVFSLFFVKFYFYVFVKLIKTNFVKYVSIQIVSALLNIFFTWLFIDVFLIPTIISSTMVVAGLFLIRFILFNLMGLMKSAN